VRLSLRYRLLVPLAVLVAGDIAATAWAAAVAARHAEGRIAAQLRAVAETVETPPTFPLTLPVLRQMKGLSGVEFVFAPRGDEPISTFPDPFDPLPADAPPPDAGLLAPPIRIAGEPYRVSKLTLPPPHRNAGGVLFLCYPESLRESAVGDAVRPAVWLGVAVGVSALLLFAIGSRLVSRIRHLEHRTRLIAAGDFAPLPLTSPNDELRDLTRSVNDMLRRLAELQDALRQTERLRVLGQFSGGLAHQLRNAAAGAKLAIQLHATDVPPADREPLDVALRQLARIERNLSQFLTLGKPPDGAKQECDLVELLDQEVSLHRPQCRHTNCELTWNRPADGMPFTGDATQLGHLFGNLIGNAVEAAGPGGCVEVRIGEGEAFRIEVIDTGPGPSADVADRLFEPFVTGKEQGIGLGLAVAKQAAEAHGGTITWTRRDGRTVFAVWLPNQ
jgi:signal transduction histidine kinase